MVAAAKLYCTVEPVRLREQADDVVWIGPLLANQDIHHGSASDRRVIPLGHRAEDGSSPLYDRVVASLTEQIRSKFRPALMLSSHPDDFPTDDAEVRAALAEGVAAGVIVDVRDVHRSQAEALGIRQTVERGTYLGVRLTELGRKAYEAGAMPYQSVYLSGPFEDDEGRVWPAWLHEVSVVPEPRFKAVIPSDELRGVRLREVPDDALETLLSAFQALAASLAPDKAEDDGASEEDAPEDDEGDNETDELEEAKMSEVKAAGKNAPDLSLKLAEKDAEISDLNARLSEVTTALENERGNNQNLSAKVEAIEAALAERDRSDAISQVEERVTDLGGKLGEAKRQALRLAHGTDLFGKLADEFVEDAGRRAPQVTDRKALALNGDLKIDQAALMEQALRLRASSGTNNRGEYRLSLDDALAQVRGGDA